MALTQVDQGLLNSYAQYTGFKNRIINGNMGIWQRGTSVTPSLGSLTSYVVDRWASYQTGAAAAVYKSTGFNGQPNCAAFNGVASNSSVVLFQPIESVNCSDLVGATITLSVWLYSTVASKAVSIYIDTANSVDSFSSTTQRASSSVSVSAGTWTQYTLTYSNADAAVANGIRVRIDFGACTSGTYAITGVQLEKGSTATSFDYRPYGTELQLCQRYYYKTISDSSYGQVGTAFLSGSTAGTAIFPFPVPMRVVASSIDWSGLATCQYASAPAIAWTSSSLSGQGTKNLGNVSFSTGATAGGTGLSVQIIANNNSNAYIGFSAEL